MSGDAPTRRGFCFMFIQGMPVPPLGMGSCRAAFVIRISQTHGGLGNENSNGVVCGGCGMRVDD